VTQPEAEVVCTPDGYVFRGALAKRVQQFCKREGISPDQLVVAALEKALGAAPQPKLVSVPITVPQSILSWAEACAVIRGESLNTLIVNLILREKARKEGNLQ
jgi:hypothetical protein